MESRLGQSVQAVSTSGLWGLLDGFLTKVNKKIKGKAVSRHELLTFLRSTGNEVLNAHGVWLFKTGDTFIVCTNPNWGRARRREVAETGAVATACRWTHGHMSGRERTPLHAIPYTNASPLFQP